MQKSRFALIVLLVLLGMSFGARMRGSSLPLAHSTTVTGSMTIFAMNDTKTISSSTSWQSGYNLTQLQLGNDSNASPSNEAWGWFKFNVTDFKDLYGLNITFTSATLRFFCWTIDYYLYTYNNTYYPSSIDPGNETWGYNTITWANQPTVYSFSEATNSVNVSSAPSWYYWTLRTGDPASGVGALQDCYDNNMTKSYVLRVCSNSSGMNDFMSSWGSRESTTWPALEITFEQTLTITVNPQITVIGSGNASLFPDTGPYLFGSTIYGIATPSTGYYLGKWQRNGIDQTETSNPYQFTNLQNSEIFTAVFYANTGTNPNPATGGTSASISLPNLPYALAYALGMPGNLFAGQLLATLILMSLFLLPTLFICSKYNRNGLIPSIFIGFMSLTVGIAAFGLPYWILLVITLVIALMFAGAMRDWLTGRGGGG